MHGRSWRSRSFLCQRDLIEEALLQIDRCSAQVRDSQETRRTRKINATMTCHKTGYATSYYSRHIADSTPDLMSLPEVTTTGLKWTRSEPEENPSNLVRY